MNVCAECGGDPTACGHYRPDGEPWEGLAS
jgi:hypothetical protein